MKKIAFAFTLSLAVISVTAQEQVLTFQDAVKIALDNNVTIKQQENQQYVTQAQKLSSMARFAPTLSASAQAWKTQGNQFIEQEARVVNDAETNNFFGSVDANLTIFNGLTNYNTLRQANARLESQTHLVNRSRQTVMSQVANQYLQVLLSAEILKIRSQNLVTQEKTYEQIEEQVKAGSMAKVDLFNQEGQVATARLQKIRAEIALRNNKTTLAQTLLLDPTEQFDVIEPAWSVENTGFESLDINELTTSALTNRGDYLSAQKEVTAAKRGQAIARATQIPSIGAFGRINSRYSNASVPSFGDQMTDNRRTQYGVSMNIPIFTSFQNRTQFVQAKINYENSKLTEDNLKVQVKSDVLRAYENYRDAITNFDATKAQLDAAEVSFGFEEERYQLQITDFVQYTTASDNYIQAQTDYAQARYTMLFQKLLLDFAVGTLRVEDIP